MKNLDEKTKKIATEYAKFCMVQLLSEHEYGYVEISKTEMSKITNILARIDSVSLDKILTP